MGIRKKAGGMESIPLGKKEGKGKQDLLSILSAIRPGLSTKGILEELSCYAFLGDRIVTYNDKVCFIIPYDSGLEALVDGGRFYKLLEGLPGRDFTMQLKGNSLKVTGGSSTFSLPTIDPKGSMREIVQEVEKGKGWKNIQRSMIDSLLLCSYYASRNFSRPALTGVYLEGKDVISTDGYRITWSLLDSYEDLKVLIPASACQLLRSFEFVEWSLKEGWIRFRGKGGEIFCARLIGEEYQEGVTSFFPKKVDKKKVVGIPKDFTGELQNTLHLLDSKILSEMEVQVEVKGGRIYCDTGEQERGRYEGSVTMGGELGMDFKLDINPLFMLEAMKQGDIQMYVVDESKVLFFNESFKHLVSLV